MTLEEAVAAFEKDFTVLPATPYHDEDASDPTRCPTGERYTILTSGGTRQESGKEAALFRTEADAVEAWLKRAWGFAEANKGNTLYWAQEPRYSAKEYIAVNQAELMNDPAWRGSIVLKLGTVYSKLAIGKVEDERGQSSKNELRPVSEGRGR